jgi:hypothetical protein
VTSAPTAPKSTNGTNASKASAPTNGRARNAEAVAREVADAALRSADLDPVLALLETHKQAQADAAQHLERARTLWNDFCARRSQRARARVPKPATYAAAIEYTLSKLAGGTGVTQAELARRYNVTTRAIASRHEEIRATLELEPGDTRYSDSAR